MPEHCARHRLADRQPAPPPDPPAAHRYTYQDFRGLEELEGDLNDADGLAHVLITVAGAGVEFGLDPPQCDGAETVAHHLIQTIRRIYHDVSVLKDLGVFDGIAEDPRDER